ncbi:aquaporin AQPAe.a-like [Haliotis asinina]|uniref:aquaporin AQPAe.a-like n=1 Tax=Haliotis asinina TaxID=109174 RepID=UPI0035318386
MSSRSYAGRMTGQYSHVHNGQPVTRNYRQLRLCEVANMVMKAEIKTIEFWRAVISECLGSMFYVLLGCSATLFCENFRDYRYDILLVSFSFGFTMATLVQCFGHISGAHFNPVVSLAMTITCKVTPLRGILYCIAQCGGGIAGAAVLYGITPSKCHKQLGVTILDSQVSMWQGLGIETLLTFIMVFAVFATIDPNRKELGSKALAIGVAVALCHLAGYRFTTSSMNPARSLGPAFVMNRWKNHWIYWVGPMVGGLMSGLLYEYIFDPSRSRRKPRSVEESPSYPDPDEDEVSTLPTTTSSPNHAPHQYGNHVTRSYDSNLGISYGNHVIGGHGNHVSGGYGNHYNSNHDTEAGINYGGPTGGRRGYKNYMPVDNTTAGTENQAYAFDTHPRRIPPPPPARTAHMVEPVNEEILLDDVRVDHYPGRQA